MIAIGALGGSGTRAVAEVLIQAGIYMGDDLNEPNDNLVFSRLFKDTEWYRKSTISERQERMRIFQRYMTASKMTFSELISLYNAARNNKTFRSDTSFYFSNLKKLLSNSNANQNWGWKEPNTQIYLEDFFNYFEDLKYIHVLRHGLDMAFSDNKRQLNNWGWKYGIDITGSETDIELAQKQLDYWIASTKDIINKSKNHKKRFLLINHSKLCTQPKQEIDRLIEFTNISVSDSKREQLYHIPKNTGSNNRFKNKDLSIFNEKKIQFVIECGFDI